MSVPSHERHPPHVTALPRNLRALQGLYGHSLKCPSVVGPWYTKYGPTAPLRRYGPVGPSVPSPTHILVWRFGILADPHYELRTHRSFFSTSFREPLGADPCA